MHNPVIDVSAIGKLPEVAAIVCESPSIDNVESSPARSAAEGVSKPDYKFSIGWPHEPRIMPKKYVCPHCRRNQIRACTCLVVLVLLVWDNCWHCRGRYYGVAEARAIAQLPRRQQSIFR